MIISKPPALKQGDTIAITAPSFFVEKNAEFRAGVQRIVERGYNVFEAPSTQSRFENTTQPAPDRACELVSLFRRQDIQAIICSDGGSSAIELIELIDYNVIEKNPKIFSGFSDISHLQISFLTKAKIPSIYGFDIINGLGSSKKCSLEEKLFWNIAEGHIPKYNLPSKSIVIGEGSVTGTLVGGWLDSIINLSGSPYLDFDDHGSLILFFETLDLQPSRLQFMLNALRLSNWFSNVTAILIGSFVNCFETEYQDCLPSLEIILHRFAAATGKPVVLNMPFGHGDELQSLPFGIQAKLDIQNRQLSILEPYSI